MKRWALPVLAFLVACQPEPLPFTVAPDDVAIIPQPTELTFSDSHFLLHSKTHIVSVPEAEAEANFLRTSLHSITGISPSINW
ncbi:MAG: glycoside hydrolase family 20 zincin-like fold domain-containing protein, partial [Bacteroidota bacterium]